jgi:hypothetical protein
MHDRSGSREGWHHVLIVKPHRGTRAGLLVICLRRVPTASHAVMHGQGRCASRTFVGLVPNELAPGSMFHATHAYHSMCGSRCDTVEVDLYDRHPQLLEHRQ